MEPNNLWRPSDPSFIADPYPRYEQLRASAPVFQAVTGDYVVLGYEDVRQVLLDKSCLTGARATWIKKMTQYSEGRAISFAQAHQAVMGMLIQMNPPEHTDLRALLAKNWPSKDTLTDMATDISGEICSELPMGPFDLVSEVSRKLPLQMISRVLGIPENLSQNLVSHGFQLVQFLDPYLTYSELKKIEVAAAHLNTFFHDHLEQSEADLPLAIRHSLGGKEPSQATSLLVFLFIAGFETTSTLITTCLWLLLSDRSLATHLDSELRIENFVSEVLRVHSPVQVTGRTTSHPITLSGIEIPEGSTLTLCVGSANRDPTHFANASQLVLDRVKYDHLSFGYGIHRCLGNQMAQVEAVALIKGLLPMLPELEVLAPPVAPVKLTIRRIPSMMITRKN